MLVVYNTACAFVVGEFFYVYISYVIISCMCECQLYSVPRLVHSRSQVLAPHNTLGLNQ